MGVEGGDISRIDFAIVVGITEDVIDLIDLGLKCCCYNSAPCLTEGSFTLCSLYCICRCIANFSSMSFKLENNRGTS